MEYEGWDGLSTTRGDMVHHVGVGDVFVIAGQSNAAGRAKDPIEDAPEIGVSLLRDSGKWDLAAHPLGETTGSVHLGHFEPQPRSHALAALCEDS
ncbi:MAG: sialate O-acetylesterase [Eubacteriales bacterium]